MDRNTTAKPSMLCFLIIPFRSQIITKAKNPPTAPVNKENINSKRRSDRLLTHSFSRLFILRLSSSNGCALDPHWGVFQPWSVSKGLVESFAYSSRSIVLFCVSATKRLAPSVVIPKGKLKGEVEVNEVPGTNVLTVPVTITTLRIESLPESAM